MTATSLVDLIAEVASADPAAPAVTAPDATLSAGDLLERADAVAASLAVLGHRADSLVGVCLPRSSALVVAALGVLRAGGAYVALDPSLPVGRLAAIIADSGVALVLTTPALAAALMPGHGAGPVDLPGVGVAGRVAADTPVHAPGLAYAMYTSGSTGTPKGVLVEQAGVANLARWHRRAFALGPGDRCAQVAGPGFDACAWEVWGTLGAGAELVVPPDALKVDPRALRDWLVTERITVTFLPTPLAEAVVALPWPADAALRLLLTGGDRLHAAPPPGLPFALVNDYGLTEASVVTTSAVVPAGAVGLPTIGAPIDGVTIRVVDAGLRDVPAGEPGELLVGGVSLARGYLGSPELTAERFVQLGGDRWYRTGDLVRQRPDGQVDYDGRLDAQVQLRGFRVEPAEVAAVLAGHPAVGRAVALPAPDGQGLHAWVEGGADLEVADLLALAAEQLPAYMVPTAVVVLARLPETANGKIDRDALPAPSVAADAAGREAADELEAAVAETIAELLGVPSVGVEDDFLLLGGHSLLGAQLTLRLGDEFGVELGLRDLFDDPTAAGIAERIREQLVEEVSALDDETALRLAGLPDQAGPTAARSEERDDDLHDGARQPA